MVSQLESFALASAANLVPEEVNGTTADLFVRKRTAHVDLSVEQRSVRELRREQMAPLPSDQPRKINSVQGEGNEEGGREGDGERDEDVGLLSIRSDESNTNTIILKNVD